MSDLDADGRGGPRLKPRSSTDCMVGAHRKRSEYSPRRIVAGQHDDHGMVLSAEPIPPWQSVDPMHKQDRKRTVQIHSWQNPPKFEPPIATGLCVPSQGVVDKRTGLQADPMFTHHRVPGLAKELVGGRAHMRQTGLHVNPLHGQHHTRLAPDLPSPVVPDVASPGHISEHDRLNTRELTFSQQEQQHRQQARDAQQMKYAQRRDASFNREQERWENMDAKRTQEQQRAAARMNMTEFRKNDHSVPYDPVTTEYHRTSKGAALQQADQAIREKAALRARTIQQRSYSQPYNPITGAPIVPVTARLANARISDGGAMAASPTRSSMSALSNGSQTSRASSSQVPAPAGGAGRSSAPGGSQNRY